MKAQQKSKRLVEWGGGAVRKSLRSFAYVHIFISNFEPLYQVPYNWHTHQYAEP
jgi:hypothetical protein